MIISSECELIRIWGISWKLIIKWLMYNDTSNVDNLLIYLLTYPPTYLPTYLPPISYFLQPIYYLTWRTPKLFDKLNYESKVKTTEGWKIGVRSLARNTLGVEGRVGAPKWKLGWMTSKLIIHTDLHKPNNKLVNA
jgi:hypothetical protein